VKNFTKSLASRPELLKQERCSKGFLIFGLKTWQVLLMPLVAAKDEKVDEIGLRQQKSPPVCFWTGFDDEKDALRCPIFFQSGPTGFRAKSLLARCWWGRP
jgi:hypothetical protein